MFAVLQWYKCMTLQRDNSHIHLDIVGGIAGDMFIAAMLDTFDDLQSETLELVAKVLPEEAGSVILSQGINAGISGLRFCLTPPDKAKAVHHHEHSHHHTTYQYLCGFIKKSSLNLTVKQTAIDLLTIIAKAEAKIHGTTLDDVHFHELADWDSVMDVVASATILNALSQSTWSTSKLPLGGGLIKTQHGLIPAPAPATAEILTGFEFFDDGIQGERITPTGAAILRYLSDKGLLTSSSSKGIYKQQVMVLALKCLLGCRTFYGLCHLILKNLLNEQQSTVVLN